MGREEARRVGARFASTPEKNPSGSGRLVLAHGSLARWSNLRVHLPAFFQGGYFVERKNPTQPILRANALRGVTRVASDLWAPEPAQGEGRVAQGATCATEF